MIASNRKASGTVLLILITNLVAITTSDPISYEDEEATVQDEDYVKPSGRYPGAPKESPSTEIPDKSNPQIRLIEMLLQTPAPNYRPQNSKDFFDFLRDSYPLPEGYKAPLAEYDYVIVGAGSAGCALASRLSEGKPKAMILLIEAGKPEMITTDIPAIAPYFQRTDYATPYYMEHQPGVCAGMENQRCYWPRGRAVGGTSVINYMIYTRGRPQEWDRIAADGNYGWSYNDVLKYYIKSERANLPELERASHRGRNGKVSVQFVPFRTELVDAFLEAGRLFGHPTVDYNAPEELGFGYVQTTTDGGHRHSAAKAYLHPHKRRKNLHVLPYTYATKVIIDPVTKEAKGIEYVRNRLQYVVGARREVILSAGPIASPQLLMLSGIGPAKHLRNLGIPVIKDLPVGQVLYDHITFPGVVFTLNTTDVALNEISSLSVDTLVKWLTFGDGVLSTIGGVEAIGYIKTTVSDDPEPVPDIEYISLGGSIVSDGKGGSGAIRKGMKITDPIYYSAFGAIDGHQTWSAFPMLLHPKSYGRLELKNANPFSHPKLYGNYLSHPKDTATFIASIRYLIQLGESEPFKKFGAKLHPANYPTCRKFAFNTDQYWECALRTLTATLHHQIATCKMGPEYDRTAVVDPELRVYGVKRLRVVDTSVIPRTTSAHTNAPGMMIGEKAADMIKQTWGDLQTSS